MRLPASTQRAALRWAYRLGRWPRRLAALICLVLAGLSAITSHRPVPVPASADVIVAARDIGVGTTLHSSDIRAVRWPLAILPPAALRSGRGAIGSVTSAPMNAGEPITPARLRGNGITTGLSPALVAATVLVANSAAANLIHAGDTVDVLAGMPVDSDSTLPLAARVVASDVRVLAVLDDGEDGGERSPSIVVAVNRPTALALAALGDAAVTVALRAPP
jgi:pilus assembly protein CpaB